MTIHRDCGKEIRWATRDDDPDRFRPPLEFAGHAYIITEDGTAVYTSTYKAHECDPDDIKAWLDLKRRQAEAKGIPYDDIDDREAAIIAYERDQQAYRDRAMAAKCDVCKAPKGELCFNMNALKRGIKTYNKNPHPSRAEKAARES